MAKRKPYVIEIRSLPGIRHRLFYFEKWTAIRRFRTRQRAEQSLHSQER